MTREIVNQHGVQLTFDEFLDAIDDDVWTNAFGEDTPATGEPVNTYMFSHTDQQLYDRYCRHHAAMRGTQFELDARKPA